MVAVRRQSGEQARGIKIREVTPSSNSKVGWPCINGSPNYGPHRNRANGANGTGTRRVRGRTERTKTETGTVVGYLLGFPSGRRLDVLRRSESQKVA
jgi:hypothetical protein